ncbi:MAG TPA: hypothetical protein VIF62_03095 [Labilithrix sp.]|jgi:hypothetical protein
MPRLVRLAAPIALGLALVAALAPASCKSATEVTLDIRTLTPGLRCQDLKHVTIVVASNTTDAEAMIASGFSSAEVAGTCDADDRVGTLVVTPSGDTGAVVVAAAVTDDADCRPDAKYKGCIVARRVFSFAKHAGLLLPITLERSCLDVPCDQANSCRAGECQSSDTNCGGGVCTSNADPIVDDAGNEITPDGAIVQQDGAVIPPPGPPPPPPPAPIDAGVDATPGSGNDCPTLADGGTVDCYPAACCYMAAYMCGASCGPYTFNCIGRKHCGTDYCCGTDPTQGSVTTQCDPSHGVAACEYYICTTDEDCPPGLHCVGTYFAETSSNGAFILGCK